MTPEEKKQLKEIYSAIECIYELAYTSGKSKNNFELKYALEKLNELINLDESEQAINSLKSFAIKRINNGGLTYNQWIFECKKAIVNAAEELTDNISQATALIKSHRQSFYNIKDMKPKEEK